MDNDFIDNLFDGSDVSFEMKLPDLKSCQNRLVSFERSASSETILPDGRRMYLVKKRNRERRGRLFYYKLMDVYSLHMEKCDDFKSCDFCQQHFHVEYYSKQIKEKYELYCQARNQTITAIKYNKVNIPVSVIPEAPSEATLLRETQYECQGCIYTISKSVVGNDVEHASKQDPIFTFRVQFPDKMSTDSKRRKIMELFGRSRTPIDVSVRRV